MQITAKVIQHSISAYTGKEIITYELEYPRYIHAEFMTHRLFSRNAASSRAIPVETMHRQILEHDVTFVHIGKNQPGMQAKEELEPSAKNIVLNAWRSAREYCIKMAATMATAGAHKQLTNRVTEPWMMMKVVMTTTEDANWDWLRRHLDAQPEIKVLADVMHEAKSASTPMEIGFGDWHVPYVTRYMDSSGIMFYGDDGNMSIEDARIVSASCCAQVSYRKSDDSLEKAHAIFERLIGSEPVHASPIEHQATPIDYDMVIGTKDAPASLEKMAEFGITHLNVDSSLGSGNFRDWIQFRQLIPNNTKW